MQRLKNAPYLCSVIYFLVFIYLGSCEQPALTSALNQLEFEVTKENISFSHGTSFGFCVGYCRTEMVLNGTDVEYKELSWDRTPSGLPDKFYTDSISVQEWNELANSFDWEAFAALDSVIGCPDCADGGAEWIEVEYYGQTKKVTFEFGATIETIDDFVAKVREIRQRVKDRIESGARLPKIIITDQNPDSLQRDRFTLNNVTVNNDTLSLEIGNSGGCRQHYYSLYMAPRAFKESFPVQADLYLTHFENNDPCDAWLTSTQKFDIRPIADLYKQHYGRLDRIILNVYEYYEGQRDRMIRVEYAPK